MISKLHIENLRGISSGTLADLAAVNVIVGPNNAGKSTLLDALLLAVSPKPSEVLPKVVQRRTMADPGAWLLHRRRGRITARALLTVETDQNHTRAVRITARYDQPKAKLSTEVVWLEEERIRALKKALAEQQKPRPAGSTVTRAGLQGSRTTFRRLTNELNQLQAALQQKREKADPIPGTPEVHLIEPEFSDRQMPLHDLYTYVAERGLRAHAKQIVTDLIPELEDIEILTQKGQPVVYLDMRDGGALPVSVAGDGVRLLLALSFELARPEGGLVLLEEPETHLHPAAIRQAARAIHAASNRGIQIVITTHSLDLIDSLLETFGQRVEDLDKLAFYRVRLNEGELVSNRHTGQEASEARTRIAEDLR